MKITEMNLLEGEEENITLTRLRQAPGDIFTQVQMGKTFWVTKNGKKIAKISKP